MKSNNLSFLLLAAFIGFSTQSCLKDKCERTVSYIKVEPVYKSLAEIHSGEVVVEAPREMKNPGKIYYYNNQIFVNERREGIHVIDNTDPANPVNTAFISIPGNEDMAIKNGLLYANSFIDLLTIEMDGYQLLTRTESVFPPLWEDVQNNQIAVYYSETPVTEVMDCDSYSSLKNFGGELVFVDVDFAADFEAQNENAGSGGTGIGGSMARFTIVSDYLYVVDDASLRVFDLTQPTQPSEASVVNLGWGIETIFPYEDKLFIGSNSGMFIYDNSNPTMPTQLATFAHARACDPVFVKDNFAYVTLRDGSLCEGFNNQLDLVDISNITNPVLVKSFPMDNPHGLSIKNASLYLCEGSFGVKSFDITDPKVLAQHLLDHEKGIHAFDAIALPGAANLLLVVGEDGFYQYNIDNPADLKLLSKITIKQ